MPGCLLQRLRCCLLGILPFLLDGELLGLLFQPFGLGLLVPALRLGHQGCLVPGEPGLHAGPVAERPVVLGVPALGNDVRPQRALQDPGFRQIRAIEQGGADRRLVAEPVRDSLPVRDVVPAPLGSRAAAGLVGFD